MIVNIPKFHRNQLLGGESFQLPAKVGEKYVRHDMSLLGGSEGRNVRRLENHLYIKNIEE